MTELLSESQQKLLELASKCSVRYEEEKKKFPYHINIIHELHDNENAPDKQKEFLYGVYEDEEIQTVIRIVFDTFEKLNNGNK